MISDPDVGHDPRDHTELQRPGQGLRGGDLDQRALRDLYNKDVQDVVVEGEAGYRNAKDFMRMLMPSQARNVHHIATRTLFQRMHIESQLDSMFSPTVTLLRRLYRHNQTEALVSIDVNSGRATASIRSRRPRARPTWKPPTRSAASSGCATWPA